MKAQIEGLYVLRLAEPARMAVLHQGKFPLYRRAYLLTARLDEETLLFDLPSRLGLCLQGDGLHLPKYTQLPACLRGWFLLERFCDLWVEYDVIVGEVRPVR